MWKIDFADFLCVARLSCAYTKTTIRLIGSLKLLEFSGIFGSPTRTLLAPYIEASIWPNFEDQFIKNQRSLYETKTLASYFMSFEYTKVTFINIEIEWSYQRDFKGTPIIEPDQTRENRSTSNSIYEKWDGLFQSNQRSWKVSAIHSVITERNLAARPWWNIYSPLNLPNFGDLQVLAPHWKTR